MELHFVELWCRNRNHFQSSDEWSLSFLLVGLEPDLTSYNAAMTACERGSQWQQAAIVKTTCTTFAQQWIWNDDSVSMKSLQTLQVCRYWQVILQRQSRELKALQFLFKPSLRTPRSTWTRADSHMGWWYYNTNKYLFHLVSDFGQKATI